MEPGLYIVGTPIGNLGDSTARARETLAEVDIILAEDTRHTRKLLNAYAIKTPLKSCHKFNEAARCELLHRLVADEGKAVAIVTDSGMPAVSDPGSRLVKYCHENELYVTVIPGPSALTSAVALSGMCEYGFLFEAFLPHKSGARKRRLEEVAALDVSIVLFESPYRIPRLLDELDDVVPGRQVFMVREITKKFEEVFRGTPSEIREAIGERSLKGEFVVVIQREGGPGRRKKSNRLEP